MRALDVFVQMKGLTAATGLFYPFFYLQLFASAHNLSQGVSRALDEARSKLTRPQISFYSLTILNAASVFGRTLPNFLADKLGPFNMIVSTCLPSPRRAESDTRFADPLRLHDFDPRARHDLLRGRDR